MAITHQIQPENGLVVLTAHGPVSAEDVEASHRLLRDDPAFRPEFHQLFDFRDSTPSDIRGGDVDSLLESAPYGPTSRRAYVVSPGLGYGMARIAEAKAEYRQLQLKVFLDFDEARRWVTAG